MFFFFHFLNLQEPRTPGSAIPDLDDDSASVQSQETDKQLSDTPTSSLSKSSNDSKESTPQPSDDVSSKKDSKESSVDKEVPEQEKKVKLSLLYFCSFRTFKLIFLHAFLDC